MGDDFGVAPSSTSEGRARTPMTSSSDSRSRTVYRVGSLAGSTRSRAVRTGTDSGSDPKVNGGTTSGTGSGPNGTNGSRSSRNGAGDHRRARESGLHLPSWSRHRRYVNARKARRRDVRMARRTPWGRHPVAACTFAVVLLLAPVWLSFGSAVTNPALGYSTSARVAEWSRDHGFSGVINWVENIYYSHHQPRVGGQPGAGAVPTTGPNVASPANRHGGLPLPASLKPFPATALAGEGKWVPAGRLVNGVPAIYTTFMRPDAIHTSVVDGVAWMDTRLLAATLYSGSYIPGGGPYTHTAPIQPSAATSLVAAFNAGFRLQDSQGGYYTEGKVIAPLVNGAASLVIYRDGSSALGAWGREVHMAPNVVSVRQNLSLLVDSGHAVPGIATNQKSQWGTVLGNSDYVARSALGVTANGALVYVGGPNLNAVDLASLLVRAGAVRGMELDINADWVNYSIYKPATATGQATPANGTGLLPPVDMSPPYADRYFLGYWARDFITMSAKPAAPSTGG